MKIKFLFILSMLFFGRLFGTSLSLDHRNSKKIDNEDCDEFFPPKDGTLRPLEGNILDGQYYSPKLIFSCKAVDFGQGYYLSQDTMMNEFAMVAFYNSMGNFKKVEIFTPPRLEHKVYNLREAFNCLGINILKKLDHAEEIEILKEESVQDALFIAISIKKTSVLRSEKGKHMESTRGYLIYQEKEKLIMMTHQIVTPPEEKHNPRSHIEELKNEILEFRKSLKLAHKESVV